MIQFGGDFVVQKKPDEVYEFLVDPERFCPLLPDYQSMNKQSDKEFSVVMRVGISHIRGNATVRMSLAEEKPTSHAAYDGKGDVPGGNVNYTRRIRSRAERHRHESLMERRSANRRTAAIHCGRAARAAG